MVLTKLHLGFGVTHYLERAVLVLVQLFVEYFFLAYLWSDCDILASRLSRPTVIGSLHRGVEQHEKEYQEHDPASALLVIESSTFFTASSRAPLAIKAACGGHLGE